MSSTRAIRGTKAKIFLYVSAVLIITGLIACYNNTLTQLDDIRKANQNCQQQQENLSTQLQVITDYKIKIEKSLKNEKAEHQQSKKDLEVKISEAKMKGEKASNDALLKYNSLQQHYNLLKTKQEDFQDETSKIQQKQLDEINTLKAKLDEVREELKRVQSLKESLKTQLTEVEIEAQRLKYANNNASDQSAAVDFWKDKYSQLENKYSYLKRECGARDTIQAPPAPPNQIDSQKMNLPIPPNAAPVSSSTASGPKLSENNGVKPLLVPNVTPESGKKVLKVPIGVVQEVPRENQNEQPEVNKEVVNPKKEERKEDNVEKDNGAHEVFDAPIQNPNNNMDSNHVKEGNAAAAIEIGNDKEKKVDPEYKDLQHEEDDDAEDYPNPALGDGFPVRN